MADEKTPAADKPEKTPAAEKPATVPVTYLVDFGDHAKGDTGRLPVSEAWRLSWRNIVRQTNVQK